MPLKRALLLCLTMTAAGCADPPPSTGESQGAVHGTSAGGIDTVWSAVGFLTGNSTDVHPTRPSDPADLCADSLPAGQALASGRLPLRSGLPE